MATASEILRTLPDAELRQASQEALGWVKTGILRGDALRAIAARLEAEAGLSHEGMLRDTDTLVCREAARRFAAANAYNPQPSRYVHLDAQGRHLAEQNEPIPLERIATGDQVVTLHQLVG